MKERILDIGIGSGGEYLRNRPSTEEQYGMDINFQRLKLLKQNYPDVIPVRASAGRLPFQSNSFQKIQFILPHDTLINPGLEVAPSDQDYPHGWYPEFQRILSP